MDYYLLVDLAMELGCELALNGAETFRIEDSVRMVLGAYHIEAEVFAIPNCITISIAGENGKPLTRMRRIGVHGNNLDAVERFNALSRRLCAETPDPEIAMQWLEDTRKSRLEYSFPMHLLGNFVGSFGFSLFFGGSPLDGFWAGVCGLIVGYVELITGKLKTNQLFATITSSFLTAITAYLLGYWGLTPNADTVIIGTLMILVPGMIFTNSMRDIIYGDVNSGINRMVQVVLIAVSISLGTAAAWNLIGIFLPYPVSGTVISYPFLIRCLVSMIGCCGFAICFNVHGGGIWLCAIGGFMTWAVYLIVENLGFGVITASFWGAVFASIYSETMARIRKYPAISYLVVSAFPLFPGSGLYYTMSFALQGEQAKCLDKGIETVCIAGVMAVGIFLVSSMVRSFYVWKRQVSHLHL